MFGSLTGILPIPKLSKSEYTYFGSFLWLTTLLSLVTARGISTGIQNAAEYTIISKAAGKFNEKPLE